LDVCSTPRANRKVMVQSEYSRVHWNTLNGAVKIFQSALEWSGMMTECSGPGILYEVMGIVHTHQHARTLGGHGSTHVQLAGLSLVNVNGQPLACLVRQHQASPDPEHVQLSLTVCGPCGVAHGSWAANNQRVARDCAANRPMSGD
jgi:hypothetical protein